MRKILIVEDEFLVAHHLKLILLEAGYLVCGMLGSVSDALAFIPKQKPDLVLLDIQLTGELTGIDLAKVLTTQGIAFVYLTANFQGKLLEQAKATFPVGFIVKPFREHDLLTTLEVAFFRLQHSHEILQRQELELSKHLDELRIANINQQARYIEIARQFQSYVPFDYLHIVNYSTNSSTPFGLSLLRVGFDEYQFLGINGLAQVNKVDIKSLEMMYAAFDPLGRATIFNADDFEVMTTQQPVSRIITDAHDTASALFFPVQQNESTTLCLEFYNRRDFSYNHSHITLLSRVSAGLVRVLSRSSEGIVSSNVALVDKAIVAEASEFNGILATSSLMQSVKTLIATVAPLDTSVIILGESGTGKEMVAKAIHAMSIRKDKPLVIVNCASLPINLVESELFGHEKGAFTGAMDRRIGKFELANNGTIFLDEIGELSADLQVKLLRVLQEQEIERIGGKSPIKINVRVIAATNRDLEQEMETGRFRLDLYYRLYVFPILVPPLRERPEDIAILARYFINRFCSKYKLPIKTLSNEVLQQLMAYQWPGNVRELEHLIERSLLLSPGPEITNVSLPKREGKADTGGNLVDSRMKTMNENERDYIIAVLEKCNGRIRGVNGAAAVMGLPPTTLHSRIKKLGIK